MTRRGIPVLGVLVLLLGAGCGVSQREAESSAAANGFLSALDGGDAGRACALLAPSTKASLPDGEPCARALDALDLRAGEVRHTSVWRDRALVRTDRDTMFLVELAAGWRIAAAGCTHQREDVYQCTLESS